MTEFGLFPTYDDNMNLKGYEAAFEVTTVEEISKIAITGVVWNDRKVYTDLAHVKAE